MENSPVLQIRKLRLRKVKEYAQYYPSGRLKNQDSYSSWPGFSEAPCHLSFWRRPTSCSGSSS